MDEPQQAASGSSDNQALVTFEKSLEALQTAVKKLESGDLPLEEALKHFEQGISYVKACQEYLNVAEKRVEILMQNPSTSEFKTQNFQE